MNRTTKKICSPIGLTALAVTLCTGVATTVASAQPPSGSVVVVDYQRLDTLGIDRTAVDLAVAALVR